MTNIPGISLDVPASANPSMTTSPVAESVETCAAYTVASDPAGWDNIDDRKVFVDRVQQVSLTA